MALNFRTFVLTLAALAAGELPAQTSSWTRHHDRLLIARSADGNYFHYGLHDNNGQVTPDSVKKISPGGQLLWQIGFPANILLEALAPAPDGGFYLAGVFNNQFSYGGFSFSGNPGNSTMWVARCDKSGVMLWATATSGSGKCYPSALAANGDKVVVAGSIEGNVTLLNNTVNLPGTWQVFVSVIDRNGGLIAMNHAVSTSTTTGGQNHVSTSQVNSAGIDGTGNVYLLVRTFGKCQIGNMSIGEWDSYNEYGPNTSGVLKFDSSLLPLRKTELETCHYFCTFYNDLQVRQNGECYYISSFGYAQSGNDEMMSAIHKLDQGGSIAGTYSLHPQKKSVVTDIALDDCENVYFTGHYRDRYNTNNPVCFDLVAGRLSPSLAQDWIYNFTDCSNYLSGSCVAFAGGDACVVSGHFEDTLKMGNPPLTHTAQGSFVTGIQGPSVSPCVKITTGLAQKAPGKAGLMLSPNPATDKVRVRVNYDITKIAVYDLTGQLVRYSDSEMVDVKGLHPGVYFVQASGPGEEKSTGRLIVER